MTENERKQDKWNLDGIIKYLYKKNELGGDDNEKQYQVENATLDLLEELQQYRAIGTVEECREARESLKSKEAYIKQILWERDIAIGQLSEIGVSLGEKMDSVKEAIERHRAKKPIKDEHNHDCCPNCGWIVYQDEWGGRYLPHCENCGQAIDFGGVNEI